MTLLPKNGVFRILQSQIILFRLTATDFALQNLRVGHDPPLQTFSDTMKTHRKIFGVFCVPWRGEHEVWCKQLLSPSGVWVASSKGNDDDNEWMLLSPSGVWVVSLTRKQRRGTDNSLPRGEGGPKGRERNSGRKPKVLAMGQTCYRGRFSTQHSALAAGIGPLTGCGLRPAKYASKIS